MAGVHDVSVTMTLDDKVSGTLKIIQDNMEKLLQTAEKYNKLTKNFTGTNSSFNTSLGKTSINARNSSSEIGKLKSSIKGLVGTYFSVQTLKTAFNWSDELTLTQGKLAQLTDDVEGFMDKAYQMSQDARVSYMDSASQMAKMWQLTDGTDGIFETEDKLIQFNELLNKSFTLGGSGVREINASMYQLTQALSSGRLQGDELRSLSENAPYLISTITDSILEMYNAGKSESEKLTELTYNDLKKLGAEGVLTSEVIVDAVLNSSDKIREAYENITPTFEQTFTILKNQVQYVAAPVLKKLNEMLNSESFAKMSQSMIKLFSVVMAILVPILELVMEIGAFISDNWSWIEPIVWGIVGALAAYLAYTKLAQVWTFALAVAKGIYMAVTLGATYSETAHATSLAVFNKLLPIVTGLTNIYAGAKALLTGVTWAEVVATYGLMTALLSVVAIVGVVIAAVYLIIAAYNKLTGSTISATGVIMGAFYVLGAYLYNRIADIWNLLVSFAELLTNLFTDPVYAVKKAFGEMAIAIIDAWMRVNDALISIVGSIADEINVLLGYIESMINGVVDAYNNTLGKKFGKWDKVSVKLTTDPYKTQNAMLGNWKSSIQNWMGEPGDNYISLDKYKMDKKDYGEMYNKGYDVWSGYADKIKGFFNTDNLFENGTTFNPEDYMSDLDGIPGMDEYLNSVPDYDGGKVPTSKDLPDYLSDALGNIDGNVDDIASMSKEELKYLRDIAEQKVINRFTTAEIKVTNHMNNNINSDRDIDGMADYFAEVLMKAADTTAEKINSTG